MVAVGLLPRTTTSGGCSPQTQETGADSSDALRRADVRGNWHLVEKKRWDSSYHSVFPCAMLLAGSPGTIRLRSVQGVDDVLAGDGGGNLCRDVQLGREISRLSSSQRAGGFLC